MMESTLIATLLVLVVSSLFNNLLLYKILKIQAKDEPVFSTPSVNISKPSFMKSRKDLKPVVMDEQAIMDLEQDG